MAGAAAGLGAAGWAARDYRRWRSLGQGGLPGTWRGWLTTTRWRLMARDPLSLAPFAARIGEPGDRARLGDLPRRQGRRPRVAPHPVPHRQLDQHADAATLAALRARVAAAVAASPARLTFATSHFERHVLAVTARRQCCADAEATHGEIGHVHPHDGSMHMVLGPSDAKAVIAVGWGERHGLAGIALGLPLTYLLIYAPRRKEEVEAVESILAAAIAHMTCEAIG